MDRLHFKRLWALPVAMWFILMGSAGADDTARRIQQLTVQRDYQAAYEFAVGVLPDRMGDPDFDFQFALAALGVNRHGEAVLALERVLVNQPGNQRARLELGRAYIALGEFNNAKRTFEQVLAANPPSNVRARIALLLSFIDTQLARTRWHNSVWGVATAGYDSNVNAGTGVNSVTVPALGGSVTLDPSSQEIEDGFTELAVGGELKYQVNQQAFGFGTMSMRDHSNFDSDAFDTVVASTQLGWEQNYSGNRWRIPVSIEGLWLDGERYRETASGAVEWTRERPRHLVPGAFVQAGAMAYPTQAERDTKFWIVGAGLSGGMASRNYSFNFYYGDEDADDNAGTHNGRRYGGARFSGQWSFTQHVAMVAQCGAQESEYNAPDPVFASVRRETMYHGGVGLAWRSSGRLTWRLDGSFIANDSNLELYEYSRSVISGSVNYAF